MGNEPVCPDYQVAAWPVDEPMRLKDLTATGLLDSPAEPLFDDITQLAAQLLDMPMALISLVDAHRQWFKSAWGLGVTETPRDVAFCAHAILGSQLFVVEQALEDPRFAANPLVRGEPEIRFYAGMPLRSAKGYALGTLCVLDRQPRYLDERQRQVLQRLAVICETLIQERQQRLQREAALHLVHSALDNVVEAVFQVSATGRLNPLNRVAQSWLAQLQQLLATGESWVRSLAVWPDQALVCWLLHPDSTVQGVQRLLEWLRSAVSTVCIPWRTGQMETVRLQMHPVTEQEFVLIARVELLTNDVAVVSEDETEELLLHNSEFGIWHYDMQSGLIRISSEWLQARGLPPLSAEAVPAEEWRQRVHPEDLTRIQLTLSSLRKGVNKAYFFNFRVQHPDGHWLWLQSQGEVRRWDAEGKPLSLRGIHTDISLIKSLEIKSFSQQQLLNAVVRASLAVSIIATDLQGVITLFSAGAEQLLGYSADEVVGRLTPVVIHDADEVRHVAEELSARSGRLIEGFEVFVTLAMSAEPDRLWIYVTRSGQRLVVRLSLAALYDLDGCISGYVGVAVDLSDQVRAEQRALVHEQRMLQSFRSAAHGIGMLGLDGRWLEVNDALCTMLGYSRDDLLQRDILCLLHPEDRELFPYSEAVVAQRTALESYQQQKRYVRADGTVMRGLLSVAVLYDEQGDSSGYVVQIQDITRQYQSELELRERAEFQRQLIAQVANAIVSINEEGRILSFNRAAEQMFGYEQLEALTRNLGEVLLQFYPVPEGNWLGQRRELSALHKDGHNFPVEIVVSQITVRAEISFIVVIRDLTEQKQVERMTNEIISTISHELRTPLTSILGGIGLILGGVMGEVSTEQYSLLDMAQKNGNKLNLLINDLLDIEKLVAGRMEFSLEWLDLSLLLKESMDSHRGYALKHSVQLSGIPHESIEVYVDHLRFGQVMANLLSNAIKFSPTQSVVEIEVHYTDGRCSIRVLDRGSGVPEHFRHRLFEKFAQADAGDTRLRGGTGLGLAITRELLRHMHGSVAYEDRLGGGGCFQLMVSGRLTNEL